MMGMGWSLNCLSGYDNTVSFSGQLTKYSYEEMMVLDDPTQGGISKVTAVCNLCFQEKQPSTTPLTQPGIKRNVNLCHCCPKQIF